MAVFLPDGIKPRCSYRPGRYPTRCLVPVRTGKHKAVRTQVLASLRLVVLYSGVVHGGVGIRAAWNITVVFSMSSRVVSKRDCAMTSDTAILASRFTEQTRSVVLLRMK